MNNCKVSTTILTEVHYLFKRSQRLSMHAKSWPNLVLEVMFVCILHTPIENCLICI